MKIDGLLGMFKYGAWGVVGVCVFIIAWLAYALVRIVKAKKEHILIIELINKILTQQANLHDKTRKNTCDIISKVNDIKDTLEDVEKRLIESTTEQKGAVLNIVKSIDDVITRVMDILLALNTLVNKK